MKLRFVYENGHAKLHVTFAHADRELLDRQLSAMSMVAAETDLPLGRRRSSSEHMMGYWRDSEHQTLSWAIREQLLQTGITTPSVTLRYEDNANRPPMWVLGTDVHINVALLRMRFPEDEEQVFDLGSEIPPPDAILAFVSAIHACLKLFAAMSMNAEFDIIVRKKGK